MNFKPVSKHTEKQEKDPQSGKVLLCVVKPSVNIESITVPSLSTAFAPVGNVVGMRIFDRNVKVKAFVELQTDGQAKEAIDRLHKAKVEGLGELELYLSKKTSVATQESLFASVDVDSLSLSEKGPIEEMELNPFASNAKGRPLMNSLEDFSLAFARPKPKIYSMAEIPSQPSEDAKEDFWNTQNEKACKVLILNRLDFSVINKKMLANLFGCFGNVTKILVNFESSYALVEFETELQAKLALKYLANQTFFGKPLKVKISKYSYLNIKKMDPELNPKLDCLQGDPKTFRYKRNQELKIIEPSSVLYFCSLPPSMTPKTLFDYLSIVHEPKKIIQLGKDLEENQMSYLVMFNSISEALDIISIFHNKQFDSKNIKVSFSETAS